MGLDLLSILSHGILTNADYPDEKDVRQLTVFDHGNQVGLLTESNYSTIHDAVAPTFEVETIALVSELTKAISLTSTLS